MNTPPRETLIARIRHLRRIAATADKRPSPGKPEPMAGGIDSARVEALEARMTHLERMVEGLQDSVHRESLRQSKRLSELEAQIQPAALGAALSREARERGL